MKAKCLDCFKVISVSTRFKIFNFLQDNPDGVTVSRLVKLTNLRQPTITFHLNELEKYGLLRKERNGQETLCFLKQNCVVCPLFLD